MSDRHCRYCQRIFPVSPYRPQQAVCSLISCQRRRRREYHRDKIHSDPDYAQTVRLSRKKWRDEHPGYQKQYWQNHPQAAEHNRQQQRRRDRRRRLQHLVKNNLARSQLLIFQSAVLPVRSAAASCKEHPSGVAPRGGL